MCLAGKEAVDARAKKHASLAERIAKLRMQRAMISKVRINLNKVWDMMETPNDCSGFPRTNLRRKLAIVIQESGRGQTSMDSNNNEQPANPAIIPPTNPPTNDEDMDTTTDN